MNDEFIMMYHNSNYTAVGFAKILGISRNRFYTIINKKQILREKTYNRYKVKLLKYQKSLSKKRKIISDFAK